MDYSLQRWGRSYATWMMAMRQSTTIRWKTRSGQWHWVAGTSYLPDRCAVAGERPPAQKNHQIAELLPHRWTPFA